MAFFQKFWHVMGPSVTEFCLDLLNNERPLNWINQTLIALVPKVKDPQLMEHFRPISLCTIIYKIIAKTIENRLKGCLNLVISLEQSAFFPEWQILDNVLVAFETMHKIKTIKKSKETCLALKLDMSKAYDMVNWNFLEEVMVCMRFDSNWISLILRCISLVSFFVLVNGNKFG